MEIPQLRALLCVAETGSVMVAARRLWCTQPAVTRQLRALADEPGGALFHRTTKSIMPTPPGMIAVEHARHLLQLTDDLPALVHSHRGMPNPSTCPPSQAQDVEDLAETSMLALRPW